MYCEKNKENINSFIIFNPYQKEKIKNRFNMRFFACTKGKKHINKSRFFLNSFLFIVAIFQIISTNKIYSINSNFANITFRIKKSGNPKIFGDSFNKSYYPNKIYINGENKNYVKNSYTLDQNDNFIELIWEHNEINCEYMFDSCSLITELNLSNFDTSKVLSMYYMFNDCKSLISLNLSNFDTSKVNDMNSMFSGCLNLISLNLSNFDTSKVTDMSSMFNKCEKLELLYINNFDISNIEAMCSMFSCCYSLKSLDISNFAKSKAKTIVKMFYCCSSLTSLNLSKFDTSETLFMNNMFEGCSSLEYINVEIIKQDKLITCPNMFEQVPDNVVICLDENNDKIYDQIKNKKCLVIYCSDDWNLKKKLINDENGECIDNYTYVTQYNNEYNNIIDETIINENTIVVTNSNHSTNGINNMSLCEELEKCLYCPLEAKQYNLCTKCNINYYQKENDNSNIGEFFNCYKDLNGYYLDKNESLYKKCYDSCDSCEIKGDYKSHNCLKCNYNFSVEISFNNYSNCYEKCIYFYYFDNENEYHCTKYNSCPEEFPVLLPDKKECIKNNSEYETSYIYNKYNKENIKNYTNFLFSEIIESSYTEDSNINNSINNYNQLSSEIVTSISGTNEGEYQLSTKITYSYNSNETQDFSGKNNLIYISSTQIGNQYDKIINIIEEKIYNILNNEKNITKEKDEIKYFDSILEIIEYIFTDENFDSFAIENGEDILIKIDKMTIILTTIKNQKNNINNNMTAINLGECEAIIRKYYNISDEELIYMKIIEMMQEKMKIPKVVFDIYSKSFGNNLTKLNLSICENNNIFISVPVEIDENENIDILNSNSKYYNDICYKSTSNSGTDILLNDRKKEYIEGNKTVCQEDCSFYNYSYDIKKVNCSCIIKQSLLNYEYMNINRTKLNEYFGETQTDTSNLKLTSCDVLSSKENIEKNTGFYLLLFILIAFIITFIIFYIKGYNLLENKIDKVIYENFKKQAKPDTQQNIKEDKINKKKKIPSKKKKSKNIKSSSHKTNVSNNLFLKKSNENKEITKIKPDTDYELNWLSYQDAKRYDKRSSCEYYSSLIISKQLFLFTFCSFNDYNSGILKKFILFLSFALHYTVNALFFNDSNIHQIYEDKGKYNFSYQFPYIIFSAIISIFILRIILQILVLTDKDILEVKIQINKKMAINMKKKKLKCMKIKFAIFFILNFLLLVLFWYYLTCFNAIYKNTQIYLIENTFISFAISLFYPFIINLLPMIIRRRSIKSSNKKLKYLYKVSQILQLI